MTQPTYDITYSEVTEESAEHGDFSDTGFVSEDNEIEIGDELTLVEVVADLIKDGYYCYPSSSVVDDSTWFETEPETDIQDGTERTEAIHFNNLPAGTLAAAWRLTGM